jgi:hypothetical protein
MTATLRWLGGKKQLQVLTENFPAMVRIVDAGFLAPGDQATPAPIPEHGGGGIQGISRCAVGGLVRHL